MFHLDIEYLPPIGGYSRRGEYPAACTESSGIFNIQVSSEHGLSPDLFASWRPHLGMHACAKSLLPPLHLMLLHNAAAAVLRRALE